MASYILVGTWHIVGREPATYDLDDLSFHVYNGHGNWPSSSLKPDYIYDVEDLFNIACCEEEPVSGEVTEWAVDLQFKNKSTGESSSPLSARDTDHLDSGQVRYRNSRLAVGSWHLVNPGDYEASMQFTVTTARGTFIFSGDPEMIVKDPDIKPPLALAAHRVAERGALSVRKALRRVTS